MARVTDKMLLEMVVENKKALKRLNEFQGRSNKIDKTSKGIFARMKKGWLGIAAGIGTAVLAFRKILGVTDRQLKAEQQLNAVIKSTGQAAGLTSKEVLKMANSLQKVTTFGDEAIIEGQNLLLTFKQIGKDVFPRATEAMLDVSVAMGQDMKTSAIQLGKALNDPITGLTAMRRVGIQFTKSQEDTIKAMVEVGDIAGAQTLILEELESQFGGSARAATKGLGIWTQVKNAFGDIGETIGKLLIPALQSLGRWMKRTLEQTQEVFDSIQENVDARKRQAAVIKSIGENLKDLGVQNEAQAEAVFRLSLAYKEWTGEIDNNDKSQRKLKKEMEGYLEILEESEITTGQQAAEILRSRKDLIFETVEAYKQEEEAIKKKSEADLLVAAEAEERAILEKERRDKALEEEKQRQKERKKLVDEVLQFEMDTEKELTKLSNDELKERLADYKQFQKAKEQLADTFVDSFLGGLEDVRSSSKDVLISMIKQFVNFVSGQLAALAAKNLASIITAPIGAAQLAAAAVVKAMGGTIASQIASAEHGMDSAPGGPVLVGERGPEIVNLPRGSEVIPNHRINMSRFSTIPRMANGGIVGGDTIDSSRRIIIENITMTAATPTDFVDQLMEFTENTNVDILNP
jgi:hypothetical protein